MAVEQRFKEEIHLLAFLIYSIATELLKQCEEGYFTINTNLRDFIGGCPTTKRIIFFYKKMV